MAKIKVTAGPGRTVPVPTSVATAPGAAMLLLREGDELEVEETDTHVRRSLIDGDFVRVADKATSSAPAKAKASTETAKEG